MDSWQPIKSAPEGRDVLLYRPTSAYQVAIAMLCEREGAKVWIDRYGIVVREFTHWMPLPEPPNG